jgi:hypothetical protein
VTAAGSETAFSSSAMLSAFLDLLDLTLEDLLLDGQDV